VTTDNSSQIHDATSNGDDVSQDGVGVAEPVSGATAAESVPVEEPSAEEQLKSEVARLKDQLLRLAADFDNFRKRSRREVGDAERKAREDLLRELLPVFDNLERAGAHVSSAADVQSVADGVQMVIKQFTDTLGRLGVERIVTVGTAFDPSVHEAIQHMETSDYSPGCIAAEVIGGYKFGERLIRPAMVVVAKAPSEGKSEGSAS
jgi:molecular chaperone GrpE